MSTVVRCNFLFIARSCQIFHTLAVGRQPLMSVNLVRPYLDFVFINFFLKIEGFEQASSNNVSDRLYFICCVFFSKPVHENKCKMYKS